MEKAVALRYDESLPAPFLVAKGKGELARKIREVAAEQGIHIAEIPDLTDALILLDVGAFIPEEFYEIIAHLLVFVRDVKERR